MVNLHTTFEDFMFTHYEDMKGKAKCRIWGGLGLDVTKGHMHCHHPKQRLRLPIRL